MKLSEFCDKLINWAPNLLMEIPKSKVDVIFLDEDCRQMIGVTCEQDHDAKVVKIHVVPKRDDYHCELKMLLDDMKRKPEDYELKVVDTHGIAYELKPSDPFEAYDSLCFDVNGKFE